MSRTHFLNTTGVRGASGKNNGAFINVLLDAPQRLKKQCRLSNSLIACRQDGGGNISRLSSQAASPPMHSHHFSSSEIQAVRHSPSLSSIPSGQHEPTAPQI